MTGPALPSRLARSARLLPPSGIREVMEAAPNPRETIRLDMGDPDFPTAAHIAEAAARAAGNSHYTATAGTAELREVAAYKMASINGLDSDFRRTFISPGAVAAISAALTATVPPRSEVLIPDPSWPNFAMMVSLCGARPKGYPLRAEEGFIPTVDDIDRLINRHTRMIIINSPSNPIGSIIPPTRLTEIVELAAHRGIWVMSDETYDQITFSGEHVSTAVAAPEHRERIITIFSCSKSYAMTGWRIGYADVPAPLMAPMTNIQEAKLSCPSSVSQAAAVAALSGPEYVITKMRDTYRMRRDRVVQGLNASGFRCLMPQGAFYVWADITHCGIGSRDFALELVRRHDVAVAPGDAFGRQGDGFVRLSLASSIEDLEEGCRRMNEFSQDLTTEKRPAPAGPDLNSGQSQPETIPAGG